LLAYALGLFCAILSVFIRDIKEVVGIVVQLWFWLTPIVYVGDILPKFVQSVMALNPFYQLATAYRVTLIQGHAPDLLPLLLLTGLATGLLLLAMWVGRHLERDIRDFL
jgi:lipopolysaccharide transport system permease protein